MTCFALECKKHVSFDGPGQRKILKAEVSETGSPLMTTIFPVAVGICCLVLSGSIILICCLMRRRSSHRKIVFESPDVVNPLYLNLPLQSTLLSKSSLQIPIDEKWMIPSEE